MNVVKTTKGALEIESQDRKAPGHVFRWKSRQSSVFVITIYMLCLPIEEDRVAVLKLPVIYAILA